MASSARKAESVITIYNCNYEVVKYAQLQKICVAVKTQPKIAIATNKHWHYGCVGGGFGPTEASVLCLQ